MKLFVRRIHGICECFPCEGIVSSDTVGYTAPTAGADVDAPGNLPMEPLTLESLLDEAIQFAEVESVHPEPALYGVTDGKAVGTYFEHKFRAYLQTEYSFRAGSSAKGIDFPDLEIDVKVTSIKQPQSSCPFRSARQKVFGLGYAILLFVYRKTDDAKTLTGRLEVLHTIFVEKQRTADFQTTTALRQIAANQGTEEDLVAFMRDRNLPLDEIEAYEIAREILQRPPEVGFLTISNALQWRLQYGRAIERAGNEDGLLRLR